MSTPRYTFRVNPKRYRELYERLELIEEGERSFWIMDALLAKLAAEQGQDIQQLVPAAIYPKPEPYSPPPPIPAMTETAAAGDGKASEVENKLDRFARMF